MNELKANVGDLVRVVTSDLVVSIGDIVEIDEVRTDSKYYYLTKGLSFADGLPHYLWADEFELYRKAGEEEPTGEFSEEACEFLVEMLGESEPTQDSVNHPNHYTQGKFETIEIIEEITQGYSDGYVAYCVGNAIKYLARAPYKHATAEEDLRKAVAYINFALEKVGR